MAQTEQTTMQRGSSRSEARLQKAAAKQAAHKAASVPRMYKVMSSTTGQSNESVLRKRIHQGKLKAQQDAKRLARERDKMKAELLEEMHREAAEKAAEERAEEEAAAAEDAELEELVRLQSEKEELAKRESQRTVWVGSISLDAATKSRVRGPMSALGKVTKVNVRRKKDVLLDRGHDERGHLRHGGAASWALVTYDKREDALRAADDVTRRSAAPFRDGLRPWRVEMVDPARLHELEDRLEAELEDDSVRQYRLSQDRNDHREALLVLFKMLDEDESGTIDGDELQHLFSAMRLEMIPEAEKRKAGIVGSDGIVALDFAQLEHLWWQCIEHGHRHDVASLEDTARLAGQDNEAVQQAQVISSVEHVPAAVRQAGLDQLDYSIKVARMEAERRKVSRRKGQQQASLLLRQKRKVASKAIRAAIAIQARWRARVQRQLYLVQRLLCMRLQAWWRSVRNKHAIREMVSNSAWETFTANTVYIRGVEGKLEKPGKLEEVVEKVWGKVLHCQVRLRERPERYAALLLFPSETCAPVDPSIHCCHVPSGNSPHQLWRRNGAHARQRQAVSACVPTS